MRLAVLLCGVVLTATGCNGARFCGYTVVRTPAGGCPTSCPAGSPTGYTTLPGKMTPQPVAAPRPFPVSAPAPGSNQDMMLVPQVIFVPQAATGSLHLSALGGRVLPSGGQQTAANPQLAEVLEQMRMINARLTDLEAKMTPRPEPVLIPPVQDPTPTPAAAAAPAAPPTATVLPPLPPTSPAWATAPTAPPQILPPIPGP